jgi:hypothetical protein
MQLLYEVETVLRSAGFRTVRPDGVDDRIEFEDNTILGFVAVHVGADEMVARWREQQDGFLRTHAAGLRRDPSKAWNTYAVFLTATPVGHSAWELLGIESDVAATRKIVRGGIITPADVRDALGPVLPLALGGAGRSGDVDALFNEKLTAEEATLFELVRDPGVDDRRLVTWLVEGTL